MTLNIINKSAVLKSDRAAHIISDSKSNSSSDILASTYAGKRYKSDSLFEQPGVENYALRKLVENNDFNNNCVLNSPLCEDHALRRLFQTPCFINNYNNANDGSYNSGHIDCHNKDSMREVLLHGKMYGTQNNIKELDSVGTVLNSGSRAHCLEELNNAN